MSNEGRTPETEVLIYVEDLSWKHDRQASHANLDGIYKVTYGMVHEVVDKSLGESQGFDDFLEMIDGVGLDNRWFRLSHELYEASICWKSQNRQVMGNLEILIAR